MAGHRLVELALDRGEDVGLARERLERADRLRLRGLQHLEAERLQLLREAAHPDAVGERRVDLQRLARLALAALRRRDVPERAHVVQPVDELDHEDAHVLRHGEHELAQILGELLLGRRLARLLREVAVDRRRLVELGRLGGALPAAAAAAEAVAVAVEDRLAELEAVELGDRVHQPRDLAAVAPLDVVERRAGVLDRVVQQPGEHRRHVDREVGEDRRHLERVRDVRLARRAALLVVVAVREAEGVPHERRRLGAVGALRHLAQQRIQPRAVLRRQPAIRRPAVGERDARQRRRRRRAKYDRPRPPRAPGRQLRAEEAEQRRAQGPDNHCAPALCAS